MWWGDGLTREEARAAGEKFFHRIEPCVKCRGTERYTGGGKCVACSKARIETPESKARKKAHNLYNDAKKRASGGTERHPHKKLFTIEREEFNKKLREASANWKDKMGFPFLYIRLGERQNPYGPSLDQVVPGKGYTPENTQIVPLFWNVFKGDHFTEKEAMDVNIRMTIGFCKNSPKLRQFVLDEIS
jgi:hypothetical protein